MRKSYGVTLRLRELDESVLANIKKIIERNEKVTQFAVHLYRDLCKSSGSIKPFSKTYVMKKWEEVKFKFVNERDYFLLILDKIDAIFSSMFKKHRGKPSYKDIPYLVRDTVYLDDGNYASVVLDHRLHVSVSNDEANVLFSPIVGKLRFYSLPDNIEKLLQRTHRVDLVMRKIDEDYTEYSINLLFLKKETTFSSKPRR